MTHTQWIRNRSPFTFSGMDIAMTNTTVADRNMYIRWTNRTTLDSMTHHSTGCILTGKAFRWNSSSCSVAGVGVGSRHDDGEFYILWLIICVDILSLLFIF
mmetsp:Transcript_23618/g.27196  ORF Transcript_23618/g.27196 Transcript_23618/m.27196 type:complete len:101 (+) Transcript_23618:979-1281(+)